MDKFTKAEYREYLVKMHEVNKKLSGRKDIHLTVKELISISKLDFEIARELYKLDNEIVD